MLVWKELNGNNFTLSYTSTNATYTCMGYKHHDGRSTGTFKDDYINNVMHKSQWYNKMNLPLQHRISYHFNSSYNVHHKHACYEIEYLYLLFEKTFSDQLSF